MDIIQVDSISNFIKEHYKRGFDDAIEKVIHKIHDHMNDIIFENIATNSPRSPEIDLLNTILKDIIKINIGD